MQLNVLYISAPAINPSESTFLWMYLKSMACTLGEESLWMGVCVIPLNRAMDAHDLLMQTASVSD